MSLLSRSLGTRPRLAVELRPEGVVAARADEGSNAFVAVSRNALSGASSVPLLHPGTPAPHASPAESSPLPALTQDERDTLVSAVRKSLETVAQRSRDTTVVVPDGAVRVLLLDFDELPGKSAEALAVVRFRLKKLVPFDVDDAAVSYQVMSSTRGLVRVLAVAMPRTLLHEYESIVRDAGFEAGAVLPSTLASLAAIPDGDTPRLIVNTSREVVTTAILRGSIVLLHRTVDLRAQESAEPVPASSRQTASLDPVEAEARIQTAALIAETQAEQPSLLTTAELAQAVSVAIAYFEDTIQTYPDALLAAGTLTAEALQAMLAHAGISGVPVRDLVDPSMLSAASGTPAPANRFSLGWFAGLRGALST